MPNNSEKSGLFSKNNEIEYFDHWGKYSTIQNTTNKIVTKTNVSGENKGNTTEKIRIKINIIKNRN